MYLLDTNHCTYLLQTRSSVLRRVAVIGNDSILTSVVVAAELRYMAYRSQQVENNLAAVQSLLRDIVIYPIDYSVADEFARLKTTLMFHFGPKERAKQRHFNLQQLGFSDNDLWIAATALRFGMTVVSADRDFARIAEVVDLQYESWLSG